MTAKRVEGQLQPGERVILIDPKGRNYLLTLREGAQFHTHSGIVEHDEVLALGEGNEVRANTGRMFLIFRPTLADTVLKMPRGAQVIYPKDLGAILLCADIGPGQKVIESGVGSGALSMALLRAGATVTGYEIREDFAKGAQANVSSYLGDEVPYQVKISDIYEGIEEENVDRIVLDLPEPWRVLQHTNTALRPGGILLAYLPSINQTMQLRRDLERHDFALASTEEILRRTWHIEDRSVRPDHRMVAHTGFLTTARKRVAQPVE